MSSYEIFPELVKDYLVVKSIKAADECLDLSIFSFEGLLFREFKFDHPDNQYEYKVDMQGIPQGNYYVMIHSNHGYIIERIQKS